MLYKPRKIINEMIINHANMLSREYKKYTPEFKQEAVNHSGLRVDQVSKKLNI